MNYQLANLSTDLRRISYWIYSGKTDLAKKSISNARNKYKIKSSIGPFNNIWSELKKVETLEGGRIKSADRASTIGSILLQASLRE